MQYVNNEEKIKKIKLDKSNFFVVIDFDRTITSKDSWDSWDAVGQFLGDEFSKKSERLFKKYRPIELDYNIDLEEKRKAMEEWYLACLNLYCEYKLDETKLKKSMEISNIFFRKGAKEFLEFMYKNDIPVFILSAGIKNVIEYFLKKENSYFNNIYIISNKIDFDENGKVLQPTRDVIHPLNKTIKGHISSEITNNREYRLLFGDLIEDKNMIPKEDWNKTIAIGFLDFKIENNLDVYNKCFDIVLTKEHSTFDNVLQNLTYIK